MQEVFGQEVTLTVHDKSGENIVFDSGGLRVDFDVRLVGKFNRGSFTIYNLVDDTIKAIVAEDNYVTLVTKLHGVQYTIAKSYYISNVIEEKVLPNSITTLYCYDSLRKDFLESQINYTVIKPTLRNCMTELCKEAGFNGEIIYKSFPDGKVDQQPPRITSEFQGSLQSCITLLQKQHKFNVYTDLGNLICMYMPTLEEIGYTELVDKEPDVILDSLNMKSNPKIGPASLYLTSNLDGNIKPSALLDASNLITVGIDNTSLDTLSTAKDFLNHISSGFSKYQAIAVQHAGSNYTSLWKTVISAISPTNGKSMSQFSWQKGA